MGQGRPTDREDEWRDRLLALRRAQAAILEVSLRAVQRRHMEVVLDFCGGNPHARRRADGPLPADALPPAERGG